MRKIYEWADYNGRNGHKVKLKLKGDLYEVAGVNVLRPFHDFRKTVKLELKRRIDLKRAQTYQGHKSDSMDDYYLFFQREDLEEAVVDSYRDQHRDQNKKGESFDSPLST